MYSEIFYVSDTLLCVFCSLIEQTLGGTADKSESCVYSERGSVKDTAPTYISV